MNKPEFKSVYSRINGIKQFLIYLNRKGYHVFVTRDISFVNGQ
jgi:hypothetical protein